MSQFLHYHENIKAIAKPGVFSKNSRAKNSGPVQIESICTEHNKHDSKIKICSGQNRKQCWKMKQEGQDGPASLT